MTDNPEEKGSALQGVGLDRQVERFVRRHDSREGRRIAGDLKGSKARSAAEKFLTRATSGAIYSITVVACFFLGVWPTVALVTAMAWLCCSEFFRITRMMGRTPNEILGLGAAVAFPLSVGIWGADGMLYVLLALVLVVACWYVFAPFAGIGDVAVTVFGPVYTSLLFSAMVLLRRSDPGFEGALLTFGAVGSIWMNDASAYAFGMRFGRNKLAPKISPNKTWEGFAGGMLGCLLVWVIIGVVGPCGVTIPLALLCGVLVGFMGVIGDLFESRIKRSAGVKDSGNFLPGHGGLLDRSDSLLFGCMSAYIILLFGGIL